MNKNVIKPQEVSKEKAINYFYNHISFSSKNIFELNKNKIDKYKNNFNENIGISIIVLCKDEERCIERCLSSIFKSIMYNDQVIIIDTGSKDNTIKIIENKFPDAYIVKEEWKDNFSEIRNLGLSLAKNEWIFFIDADEIIQEESIINLRLYLNIIESMNLKNVIINPTIINHNYHIVQGVKRILKKNEGVKFYGYVHEEPRLNNNIQDDDLLFISFDNIVLNHDGYMEDVMVKKNKLDRNLKLLKKMLDLEPNNPRWLYFYCRDGKKIIDETLYENILKKVIVNSKSKLDKQYEIRALSDLIDYYLSKGNIVLAEEFIQKLKKNYPLLSDVVYFDIYINMIKTKLNYKLLLDKVVDYRNNQKEIDYGSIHSNYFHIDYLIAKLFFEIGEYNKSFNIIKKLEKHNYNDFKNVYRDLYFALIDYYNDKNRTI